MYKYNLILSVLSEAFLKLSFGLIFFNYGYGKLKSLLTNNSDSLINMVSTIPIFGKFPVLFSWALALGEIFILIGLIYGLFNFLPLSNIVTKLAGLISLIISLVIVYQHIFVWGDNVFNYGPFNFLNVADGGKAIFGQILFLPISLYIFFSNTQNNYLINDPK